jgi:hypothetical protein
MMHIVVDDGVIWPGASFSYTHIRQRIFFFSPTVTSVVTIVSIFSHIDCSIYTGPFFPDFSVEQEQHLEMSKDDVNAHGAGDEEGGAVDKHLTQLTDIEPSAAASVSHIYCITLETYFCLILFPYFIYCWIFQFHEGEVRLSSRHEVQLLREQLDTQVQQTQEAMAHVHLLREQLTAETTARIEAQVSSQTIYQTDTVLACT